MSVSSDQVRVPAPAFEELLDGARSGEGWAFDELFRSWNAPMSGFVRSRGVSDVDGVVNDIFLKAFGALGSFSGDEASFRAWLFRIARNRVIDEYRKQGRSLKTTELSHNIEGSQVVGGDVVADFEQRLAHDRVMTLLGFLTDDQREVLILRFVADLTIDRIAEVTGRRRGAVKQLQRRALRRLEAILEG